MELVKGLSVNKHFLLLSVFHFCTVECIPENLPDSLLLITLSVIILPDGKLLLIDSKLHLILLGSLLLKGMHFDGIDRNPATKMPSQRKINSWSFLMLVIFTLGPAVEPLEGWKGLGCSVQIMVSSRALWRALHHKKIIF